MNQISIKKFSVLKRKANRYLDKHTKACSEILDLIMPILNVNMITSAFVFLHQKYGYVLSWKSSIGIENTPIIDIIEVFLISGRKFILSEEDLLSLRCDNERDKL